MTVSANMKSLFPKFSSFFDKSDQKKALQKLEPKKTLHFYRAVVHHDASYTDQKVLELKQALKERLKSYEKHKNLSKGKIQEFHDLKKEDKTRRAAKQIMPQPAAVVPPPQPDPLNLAIATLAERLRVAPTQLHSSGNAATTIETRAAQIAADHLSSMKAILSEKSPLFFTADTLSEMDGAGYNAMIDCTLLRLVQTAIYHEGQLALIGINDLLSLSSTTDFNNSFTQLRDIRQNLDALQEGEYDTLLRQLTGSDTNGAAPERVQAVIRAIGSYRQQFEQLLTTDARFLSAFTD